MQSRATRQQLRVLGVIATAIRQQGYPPSLRDICKVFGWSATNAASEHIHRLQRHGLLAPVGDTFGKARALQITARGYAVLQMEPPSPYFPSANADSAARIVPVKLGWRCANGSCVAVTFDTSKPCPMCALAKRKVA